MKLEIWEFAGWVKPGITSRKIPHGKKEVFPWENPAGLAALSLRMDPGKDPRKEGNGSRKGQGWIQGRRGMHPGKNRDGSQEESQEGSQKEGEWILGRIPGKILERTGMDPETILKMMGMDPGKDGDGSQEKQGWITGKTRDGSQGKTGVDCGMDPEKDPKKDPGKNRDGSWEGWGWIPGRAGMNPRKDPRKYPRKEQGWILGRIPGRILARMEMDPKKGRDESRKDPRKDPKKNRDGSQQ